LEAERNRKSKKSRGGRNGGEKAPWGPYQRGRREKKVAENQVVRQWRTQKYDNKSKSFEFEWSVGREEKRGKSPGQGRKKF